MIAAATEPILARNEPHEMAGRIDGRRPLSFLIGSVEFVLVSGTRDRETTRGCT
jgi:hypothetical protein